MKSYFFIVSFIMLMVIGTLSAQTDGITVTIPITGHYVAPVGIGNGTPLTELLIVDTYTVMAQLHSFDSQSIDYAVISNTQTSVAIYSFQGNVNDNIDVVNLDTGEVVSRTTVNGLAYPMSWLSNDQAILFHSFDFGLNSIISLEVGSENENQLIEFVDHNQYEFPLDYIDPAITTAQVQQINFVDINPQYPNWLVGQMQVVYPSPDGNEQFVSLFTFLFNSDTDTYVPLNPYFEGTPFTIKAEWSPDGTHLYFHLLDSERTIVLIEFDPLTSSITVSESASSKLEGDKLVVVLDWLDVADLLLLSEGNQMYIGQILSGELHIEEFFSIDRDVLGFDRIGRGDWRFEGNEEEAAELSCIFDETLPPRLEIGVQAQVAFTDGTPSRLRSEPSTWGDVVQSLPEGTIFEIIGGYMCGSGYRWWQVQLADGTQGWIAEASETEYWIERRAS